MDPDDRLRAEVPRRSSHAFNDDDPNFLGVLIIGGKEVVAEDEPPTLEGAPAQRAREATSRREERGFLSNPDERLIVVDGEEVGIADSLTTYADY